MDVLNQIGHIQYWGISPAVNFLQDCEATQSPLRVLLTGCSDIRHILKTVADTCALNKFKNVQIYFHQTQKELLCRAFLLLHIIHEQNLNFDQRVELFLDLYGNVLVKQKDTQYLNKVVPDLLNFIHDEKKTVTVLRQLVDLKHIKFEQRDEMSQIIESWKAGVPFEVEKYRDQRLRYHYKERYDFRTNLIDWDYNVLLQQFAPIIHYYHYREWRQTGVAFESRFSVYSNPNMTLSSYIPGRKNATKESCLVRGFWGDIICSPYMAFGVETDSPQKDKLFQKANLKHIGHSIELSEYNLRSYIQKIQTLKDYTKVFDDYYRSEERRIEIDRQNEREKEQAKNNTIKEEVQDQQDNEEQKPDSPTADSPKVSEKREIKPKTQAQFQQRQKITRQEKDAKEFQYQSVSQHVLEGFKEVGMKVYPICMNIDNMKKKKFQDFFDVGMVGFSHTSYFNHDLKTVFKSGAKIYCQNSHFLISHTKQERVKMNKKLQEIVKAGGLVKLQNKSKHHTLYFKP